MTTGGPIVVLWASPGAKQIEFRGGVRNSIIRKLRYSGTSVFVLPTDVHGLYQSVHPCAKLAYSQLAVRASPIDVQAVCVHRTPRLLPSRLKPHLFHPVEKSCWALALPPRLCAIHFVW